MKNETAKNNYVELEKNPELLEMKNRAGEIKKYTAWILKEFRHCRRIQWTAKWNSRNYTECCTRNKRIRKYTIDMEDRVIRSNTCNHF